MPLMLRYHGNKTNTISESKGASSHGKNHKLKVPQLPFSHWAEQGREQVAAKYKQILTASRSAAPL